MAQTIAVTYGTRVVGGAQSGTYYVHGPVEYLPETTEAASYRWHVLVRSTTESGFDTACTNLETDMRKINQVFKVTIGSTDFVDLSHSGNTGMLSRPSFEVLETANTSRSRLYRCEVRVVRPADTSGAGGLREHAYEVFEDPSGKKSMVMTGSYTATSGSSATANHAAASTGAEALALAVVNAIGPSGGWERLRPSYRPDNENKVLAFVERWAQVGYNQSAGTLNNAAIKEQFLRIERLQTAPGDLADARRLLELSVIYAASIDRDETTDLVDLWDGTILPHIQAEVETVAQSSAVAITDVRPQFDLEGNAVAASIRAVAVDASQIVSHRRVTTEITETGKVFVPAHSGDAFAAKVFDGPGLRVTIVQDDRIVARGGGGGGGSGGAISFAGYDPVEGNLLGIFGIGAATSFASGVFGQDLGIYAVNQNTVGEDFVPGAVASFDGSGGSGSGSGGGGGRNPNPDGEVVRTVRRTDPIVVGIPGSQITLTITSEVTTLRQATTPTASGVPVSSGGSGGPVSTGPREGQGGSGE